ncbi:MAG: helix-turn-helix domain-containing protein, partial [Deltaproteobacteria bacterium]|nr:helix-turn-helix domain-containing protein [Deltaproteobacteria bacterium]
MRPYGSPKLLEKRRRNAVALVDSGLSLNEVARRVGCDASSVMRWRDKRDKHGGQGLKPMP